MPDWTQLLTQTLTGTPQQVNQAPLYSTQTQQVLNQLLQQGKQQLQDNPASFGPIAAEARRGFHTEIVPAISERLTSLGGNATRAPGIKSAALQGAGQKLEASLGALGSQYNQNQQALAQNLIKLGLTPSFQNLVTPPQPGFIHSQGAQELLSQGVQGVGKVITDWAAPAVKSAISSVVGPAATGSVAAGLGTAASSAFWPVAATLAALGSAGLGFYAGNQTWKKLKNHFQSGGTVEQLFGDSPNWVQQKVLKNGDAFKKLFSDPNLPDTPPAAVQNILKNPPPGLAQLVGGAAVPESNPQNSDLNSSTAPVPSNVASTPAARVPEVQTAAQPQPVQPTQPAAQQALANDQVVTSQPVFNQAGNINKPAKGKVVCKNGKCKRVR